jgi:hypothetical protein
MESSLQVQIIPGYGPVRSRARIGGVEFPVVGFAVETDPDSGNPVLLSLALAPTSLAIGEPSTADGPELAKPAVSSWGDGSRPDPRVNIPGWTPEAVLVGQVASRAEEVTR